MLKTKRAAVLMFWDVVVRGCVATGVKVLQLQVVFSMGIHSWQGLPHVQKEVENQRACQLIYDQVLGNKCQLTGELQHQLLHCLR